MEFKNEEFVQKINNIEKLLQENSNNEAIESLKIEFQSIKEMETSVISKEKYGNFLKNLQILSKKLEILTQNLEKQEKIRKELEGDLSLMSEKLSVLKAENTNLNAKISKIAKNYWNFKKIAELTNKIQAEEQKFNSLSVEKRNLTEENDVIKEKIQVKIKKINKFNIIKNIVNKKILKNLNITHF